MTARRDGRIIGDEQQEHGHTAAISAGNETAPLLSSLSCGGGGRRAGSSGGDDDRSAVVAGPLPIRGGDAYISHAAGLPCSSQNNRAKLLLRWTMMAAAMAAISLAASVYYHLSSLSPYPASALLYTEKKEARAMPLLAKPRHPQNGSRTGSIMSEDEALGAAISTGIGVVAGSGGEAIEWVGNYGGQRKPLGPLVRKRIAVVVASEFSDFQVYYLASYVGEHGGTLEFLLVDWVDWKNVRPNVPNKGVRGMWDLSVDPMVMMGGSDKASLCKGLRDARPWDYDAVVIVGGHSADVMVTEKDVTDFIEAAAANGAVLGSIGEGSMTLIAAGIVHGKKVTGNHLVSYMLEKIADLQDASVVTDGNLITARDTVDTADFVQALCRAFDPGHEDIWKGTLEGKTVLLPVGEDYEDIELIVPTLEFLHRGAKVVIGRFQPQFKSRPYHESGFAQGNFGTTVPFQEIPDKYYSIKDLDDVHMGHFDVVVITGAMNPWNMVATGRTEWLKRAHSAGKLIAAICHGPIPVAAADLVNGMKLTGWLASKDSVEIMGGEFNPDDWAAVIDGWLITGRTPPELPEFVDAISVALLRQD